MKKKRPIFVGLLLVFVTLFLLFVGYLATQADIQIKIGQYLCEKKQYSASFWWLKKAAYQDSAEAQYYLSICFTAGLGVEQNRSEAQKWCIKSAERGFAQAQTILGLAYYHGTEMGKNYTNSFIWFKKAAEQNYAPAQDLLGGSYARGQGVIQNYEKAVDQFKKAIEQNYPWSYNNYAWLLATCPKDQYRNGDKAIELSKKATALLPGEASFIETLAAAYAEAGQLDLAVKTQQIAIELAGPENQESFLLRLRSYENGLPWRNGNTD